MVLCSTKGVPQWFALCSRAAKLAERNVKLKQRAAASGMVPAPQRVYNAPSPRPCECLDGCIVTRNSSGSFLMLLHSLRYAVALKASAAVDYEHEVSGMMVDDTVRMTYHPKSREAAMADFKVSALYCSNALYHC